MKSRKGLTLIEITITIAILSILTVVILGVFNMSITSIFKSGRRTERILKVKEEVDKKIREKENKTDGEDTILITIPGVIEGKEIKGTIIEGVHKEDTNIKITTFVPNKKQD